jgi:hypothetical protein
MGNPNLFVGGGQWKNGDVCWRNRKDGRQMMFENLYGKSICHENYGNNVCWRKNGLEWKTMEYLPRHLPSACRNVIHKKKHTP